MPELPEVETVKRGLAPVMEGATITHVDQRRPDLRFPLPERFDEELVGQHISGLSRRAKYVLVHLGNGMTLVMHLGMSGSFRIEVDAGSQIPGVFHHDRSKIADHDHITFYLKRPEGEARVIYNDPRRFGYMDLVETATLSEHKHFHALGIEPTGNSLTGDTIARLFHGKQVPLKAALLDQRLIAGLGNIYVCEALWLSGLSPRRKAGTLARKNATPTPRAALLAENVRAVIAKAIEAGGSSLRDHRQADGSLGYFQHSFNVYDREGEACRKAGCTSNIARIVQSGRSTFYCPSCQR